jgi:hypothetical protein
MISIFFICRLPMTNICGPCDVSLVTYIHRYMTYIRRLRHFCRFWPPTKIVSLYYCRGINIVFLYVVICHDLVVRTTNAWGSLSYMCVPLMRCPASINKFWIIHTTVLCLRSPLLHHALINPRKQLPRCMRQWLCAVVTWARSSLRPFMRWDARS